MDKIIIGIVGENVSGKTTMTNYLIEKYGAVSFRFSDMLSDILRRVHLEKNRENLQKLSTLLRQNFAEDIMSKTLAKDVELADAKIIVTEGVRRPTDITYLKDMPGFHLVAIQTDMRMRFDRLAGRDEKPDDKTKTWEEFQTEAGHESEQKIQEIAATAEVTIDNNGTIDEMYKQIDDMMASYGYSS